MPKVPPGYAERKRQQILDGAVACFVRSGFSRTTIGDICKETGISPAALYRYFRSKAAIVNAVVAASRREDTSRIREAAKSGTREALEELIRTFLLRVRKRTCALALELTAEASRDETLQDSAAARARADPGATDRGRPAGAGSGRTQSLFGSLGRGAPSSVCIGDSPFSMCWNLTRMSKVMSRRHGPWSSGASGAARPGPTRPNESTSPAWLPGEKR